MKRNGLIIAFAIAALIASSLACAPMGLASVRGSGRIGEKQFELDHFSEVELANFGDLYIEIGERETLRLEAEDNLIEYFDVEVRGDRLVISQRSNINLVSTRPVKFYLTAVELGTIVLSGSGDIEAPDLEAEQIDLALDGSGDIDTGKLRANTVKIRLAGSGTLDISGSQAKRQTLHLDGSGNIRLDGLEADELEVRIQGSGDVDVTGGQVAQQDITIHGSGEYRARDMACGQAHVSIPGSGLATLNVRDRLEITIMGSGDVLYAGRPTIRQSITGSGTIRHIGEE